MPRLPTAETLGERPTPRPETGVVSYRPAGGQEAPGLALVRVSQQLNQAGDEIYRAQKVEEDRVSRVLAQDALNEFGRIEQELTYGEKDGFLQKKGSDAIKTPLVKDYTARLTDAANLLKQGLKSERAKELFDAHAAQNFSRFRGAVYRHVDKEYEQFAEQTYVSSLDVELRNAVSRWNDPPAIGMTLERIFGLIDQEAERSSRPPEWRQDQKLKAESKVHTSVIGQMLATDNFQMAQQYYEQNKDGIDAVTAKAVLKSVEDGTQKQLTNGYNSAFLQARDNPKALKALEAAVASDKVLDDNRKNALLGRILSKQDTLERRGQAAYDRHIRQLDRAINQVNQTTLAGFEPTVEQMTPLITAAKGTELEPQVRQMVAVANATGQFRRAPPVQQEAMLRDAEAQARKDPSKFDVTILSRLRTIYNNQREQVREDPITFAVRQGFAETQPLDMGKPATLGPAIAQRAEIARGMRQQYQAPFNVLTKEETTLLRDALKDAPAKTKSDYFSGLAAATVGNRDAYSAIMRQIAPDDPVTAIAGVYAAKDLRSPEGKRVSDLILKGQSIMNPPTRQDGKPDTGKLIPMPAETEFRREFDRYVRDAYSSMPQARSDFYQTSKAIYAALASEAGDKDTRVLERSRFEDAMKLATGGVDRYKGRNFVLPWGHTYGQFKDGVKERIDLLEKSGALSKDMPASRVRDLPVQNVGDGRYVFTSGDGVLVGKDGRPIVIDFSPAAPFRTREGKPMVEAIPK